MVKCIKLGVKAEGLESPPFPGPDGQYIYENISRQAWQEWINMQTMLINEYRLSSFDSKSKKFLQQEREKFLFSENYEAPKDFTPE